MPRRQEATPRTQTGDLYNWGDHRLLCDDACESSAYARLLDGERPETLCTDPPYGVEYVGKTDEELRLMDDPAQGLLALLVGSLRCIDAVVSAGARLYWPTRGRRCRSSSATPTSARAGACTRRSSGQDQMVLGRSDHHSKQKPLLYAYNVLPAPVAIARSTAAPARAAARRR